MNYIITAIGNVDLHNCIDIGMDGYKLIAVIPYNNGARLFWEKI